MGVSTLTVSAREILDAADSDLGLQVLAGELQLLLGSAQLEMLVGEGGRGREEESRAEWREPHH